MYPAKRTQAQSAPPRPPLRQRLNVSRIALGHERTTILAWILIGACGLFAALRLPVAMFPDIVFPVVVVVAEAPGKTAEAMERDVTEPVERRLMALTGRKPVVFSTTAGRALASVQFEVGISLQAAQERVRGALAGLALGPGIRLQAHPVDLNEVPVVTYAVAARGSAGIAEAGRAARELASRLAAVAGVARVVPQGWEEGPAGQPPVRVRFDAEPAFALQVVKNAGANTLEVSRLLDRVVSDTPLARDVRIVPVRAEAPFIREATGSTLEALWAAVALSVLVIYPFLRSIAATAISALAIPTSLLGTFLAMALGGFQFETITLLALALVIGIIIDDAIVDVENIARHLPGCAQSRGAVLRATDEIGLTVTAATLTIVAVFVPVGFMGGVVGTFFRPFGLTISAAVLTSLLVARTLTPVLAARWLRAGRGHAPSIAWGRVSAAYLRLLALALRHPRTTLLAAALSLAGGLAIIPLIPQGFIPVLDRGECVVQFALAPGSGLEQSDDAAARLSARIRSDPDVAAVLSVVGASAGAPERGSLQVTLSAERSSTTQQVQVRLRKALSMEHLARVSVENVPIIAVAAAQPLEITLTSDDAAALPAAAFRVLEHLARLPAVADLALAGIGPGGDGTWIRRDGRPAAVIRGNLSGSAALGEVGQDVLTRIPQLLPPGVQLALAGESAQAAEVFGHFAIALALAFGGVLLVLLVLFRSWQDPLAIAISLPLSGVGAMLGLFLARSDFGIVSLLGLVFLAGLASKNAILLVDRINQLRAGGLGRDAAILEAGPVRLRPILMTTAAAVLGMVPIALGLGAGAELRAPMAVAIIGGLLTSTVLSLVVVPVVYQLLDRLAPRFVSI